MTPVNSHTFGIWNVNQTKLFGRQLLIQDVSRNLLHAGNDF